MKCTESEEEEPIKGKESQLQLSCFINQEVKYLATGLRLVCIRDIFQFLFIYFLLKRVGTPEITSPSLKHVAHMCFCSISNG